MEFLVQIRDSANWKVFRVSTLTLMNHSQAAFYTFKECLQEAAVEKGVQLLSDVTISSKIPEDFKQKIEAYKEFIQNNTASSMVVLWPDTSITKVLQIVLPRIAYALDDPNSQDFLFVGNSNIVMMYDNYISGCLMNK